MILNIAYICAYRHVDPNRQAPIRTVFSGKGWSNPRINVGTVIKSSKDRSILTVRPDMGPIYQIESRKMLDPMSFRVLNQEQSLLLAETFKKEEAMMKMYTERQSAQIREPSQQTLQAHYKPTTIEVKSASGVQRRFEVPFAVDEVKITPMLSSSPSAPSSSRTLSSSASAPSLHAQDVNVDADAYKSLFKVPSDAALHALPVYYHPVQVLPTRMYIPVAPVQYGGYAGGPTFAFPYNSSGSSSTPRPPSANRNSVSSKQKTSRPSSASSTGRSGGRSLKASTSHANIRM